MGRGEFMPADIGRFVGRYLQVLAVTSIAGMIVDAIFFNRLFLDGSWLLMLWAAPHLIRHNPKARNWTIGFCFAFLLLVVAMYTAALVFGTDRMTVELWRRIEHPTLQQVTTVAAILFTIIAIPLFFLLTPQAKREFQVSREAAA